MVRYIDYTRGEYKKLKVSSFGMATLVYERMLEIFFVGIEFEDRDKQIPDTTIVIVKLLEKQKIENLYAPFKECWTKDFSNVLVPTGV